MILIISLLLIIPIYIITINKCILENKNKKKLALAILFNPTLVYILTFIFEYIFIIIFKKDINPFLEFFFVICSSFICLGGFIYIFDKNRKNIRLYIFIYLSFILIEFTCISTILINYSFVESIISCILLPTLSYISYYFIITKKLELAIKEFDKTTSIFINLLPCITYFIILMISSIGPRFIDLTNVELYHSFSKTLVFINYSILVFEFFAYYIILNNVEKKYKLTIITNQIIKNQEQIINAFCKILENSNGETGNHVKRVSEYSKILAEELGFSKLEIENIKIATMLHDVGKIYIPNEILEKPGKLTEEEFAIIKTHVIKGEELLHNVEGDLINLAKSIALEHHEKWNGKGYLGKKKEEISLPARIVAVADVFDALVSKRSYKESWNVDEAYNLILSESGEHFDPMVVKAFKNSFSKILNIYEENIEY